MSRLYPNEGHTTRAGRVVHRPQRFDPSDDSSNTIFAVISTTEPVHHVYKPRTEGQRRKLHDRITKSKRENIPMTLDDLENAPDKAKYLQAVSKEYSAMTDRGVFEVVDRKHIPRGSEVGQLIVLLTRKRDGRYKSRLVYNGRRQRFKITEHYSSPTLRSETLCAALAVGAIRQ